MALISCRECNHQISQTAEACPQCGAPLTAPTQRRSALRPFLIILLAMLGFIVISLFASNPSTPDQPQSYEPTGDRSEKTQAARKQLLEQMITAGAFTKVQLVADTGRVYVGKRFSEFTYDQKQGVMSGLYTYFFPTIKPHQQIRLIDGYTNKTIGRFSAENGLDLD